jgi:hypothetical protein
MVIAARRSTTVFNDTPGPVSTSRLPTAAPVDLPCTIPLVAHRSGRTFVLATQPNAAAARQKNAALQAPRFRSSFPRCTTATMTQARWTPSAPLRRSTEATRPSTAVGMPPMADRGERSTIFRDRTLPTTR